MNHSFLQRATDAAIAGYQRTLSPDHGWLRVFFPYGCCRYVPTCSNFSRGAFARHGFLAGLVLTLWRLGRCHPWSRGGYDPVPDTYGVKRGTVTMPVSSHGYVKR